MRFVGRLAPSGDEGHAYGVRRPLSWEPLGSSPFAAQQIGHHRSPLGVWPCLNKLSHSSSHQQFPTNGANCRVLIWGVLHCRCEWTYTQQAQHNEFGREVGSRTGPLWGLRQRLGRIFREQVHQRRRGGVKVYPRASSEDEFFFFSSDTLWLELSGVFRTVIPLFVRYLLLFISLFRSSSSYTCQSSMPILKCMSPQPFFLALCERLWPPLRCPGVTSTLTGSEC